MTTSHSMDSPATSGATFGAQGGVTYHLLPDEIIFTNSRSSPHWVLVNLIGDRLIVEKSSGLETIGNLKSRVTEIHGDENYPSGRLRIIYDGKVLEDGVSLSSADFGPGKHVIVMKLQPRREPPARSTPAPAMANPAQSRVRTVTSAMPAVKQVTPARIVKDTVSDGSMAARSEPVMGKALSANQPVARVLNTQADPRPQRPRLLAAASATSSAASSASQPKPVSSARQQIQSAQEQPSPSVSGSRTVTEAESHLVMGDQYEETVGTIMSLGFTRDQVVRAMRMSFNNPDRATDLLLSGAVLVEENLGNPLASSASAPVPVTQQQQQNRPTGPRIPRSLRANASSTSVNQDSALFPFVQGPDLVNVRNAARQDGTQGLAKALHQLARTNPQALEAIRKEQQTFVDWLNSQEPAEGGQRPNTSASASGSTSITAVPHPHRGLQQLQPAPRPQRVVAQQSTAQSHVQRIAVPDPPQQAGNNLAPGQPGAESEMPTPPIEVESSSFQHPPVALELTESDHQAISRIAAMGFPLERVLEAYLVMGKNEAHAIELLLSTHHDFFDSDSNHSSSSHNHQNQGEQGKK